MPQLTFAKSLSAVSIKQLEEGHFLIPEMYNSHQFVLMRLIDDGKNPTNEFVGVCQGKEHQTIKAIEELAELIQALAKGDTENIKEEIADVRVMLEQIEYLYGISDDAITLRMCAKLWRQLERMEGEND